MAARVDYFSSLVDAAAAADDDGYTDGLDPTDGAFPMQDVGVNDDPFAMA